MSVESLKKDARRHEQREEWSKALDLYLQAIEAQVGEDEPDIALHNRVGDLQIRLGDIEGAVGSYERAISLYLSAELPNNAIAVCRKIIRHDPERPSAFLRMGQIRAKQGFLVDARQSFITYAEMMQLRGEIDEALRALEEFVGLAPADVDTRLFLAGLLVAQDRNEQALQYLSEAFGTVAREGDEGRKAEVLGRIHEIDPDHPTPVVAEVEPADESHGFPPDDVARDGQEDEPSDGRTEGGIPWEIEGLEITRFGDSDDSDDAHDSEPAAAGIQGLEATGLTEDRAESEEEIFGGSEQEPLSLEVESEFGLGGDDLDLEAAALDLDGLEELDDSLIAVSMEIEEADPDLLEIVGFEGEETEESDEGEEGIEAGALAGEEGEEGIQAEALVSEEDEEPGDEGPADGEADLAEGIDDLPLIRYDLEDEADSFEEAQELEADGPEGVSDSGVKLAPLPEAEADELVHPDAEPTDADGWRLLGEELFQLGEASDARDAMEMAHQAYAEAGEPEKAMLVVRELLMREPNSIELRQRAVEYALLTNERTTLVQAYLELAEGLRANGEPRKADAVFEQVLELDPGNLRANEALQAESPPPEADSESSSVEGTPSETPASSDGDYVDLGAMVLDDEPVETTRWKIAAERPTGDEEADFARMLSQFKEKVAENLSGDDARSHYDLGAAYRDMGLLQEAIGEFQQALRAQPGNLAAFEMLGQCFLEQGEPAVAIRTLERGLALATPVEDDLLGVYYWLGQAHESVGDSDSAREFYEKIFSLDINFKDVTERLKTLR